MAAKARLGYDAAVPSVHVGEHRQRGTSPEAGHGRQDSETTAEGQEAKAGEQAAYEERLVASKGKGAGPTTPGRHFKRRRLELAEGGALVMSGDGSIEQIDAAGTSTGKWLPTDPEWPHYAIRFGLLPHAQTIAPHGPDVPEPKM